MDSVTETATSLSWLDHALTGLHYAWSFFLILSVIVFIHEFGHYLVARLCGVRITAFSIGFGKEIVGWNDSHGTRWKISLIPMGGYVKMYGDASAASTPDNEAAEAMTPEQKAVSFHYKPLWKKALVVVAGPVANFLLTIVVLTGLILANGVGSTAPVAGEIMPDSAAFEAGLQTGDRILEINGEEVSRFDDLTRIIATNLGTPVELDVQRGDEEFTLTLSPRMTEAEDAFGNKIERPLIGIRSQEYEFMELNFFQAVGEAVIRTYHICAMTLHAVGQMIVGDRGTEELKGPIGIAKLSGQATQLDFMSVLWFIAMLSANLGLINLFPIPLLDGGHLMYYAIEGATGKPLAEKFQEYGFRVGFALIICLMSYTILNDIRAFF